MVSPNTGSNIAWRLYTFVLKIPSRCIDRKKKHYWNLQSHKLDRQTGTSKSPFHVWFRLSMLVRFVVASSSFDLYTTRRFEPFIWALMVTTYSSTPKIFIENRLYTEVHQHMGYQMPRTMRDDIFDCCSIQYENIGKSISKFHNNEKKNRNIFD